MNKEKEQDYQALVHHIKNCLQRKKDGKEFGGYIYWINYCCGRITQGMSQNEADWMVKEVEEIKELLK